MSYSYSILPCTDRLDKKKKKKKKKRQQLPIKMTASLTHSLIIY